jgi:hypothetical protein
MQDYTPFFPEGNKPINYTVNGIKPKTTNTTFYNNKDLYETPELAIDRANNIGCSGYRSIIANANGSYKFAPCSDFNDYKKIMKEMSKTTVERRYYDFDPGQNIYDIRDTVNDNLYNGFDYQNQILKRSLSNVIYRDPIKEGILNYFQRVVYGLVETTKQIKNFFNYTVKKNNKRVF